MKKSLSAIIILTLILTVLISACGGKTIKNDVAVSALSSSVESVLSGDTEFVDAPESYITSSMKLDVATISEYTVRINSRGVDIDEYGIFKASDDAQLKTLQTMANDYLQFRLESWMEEYMPEQFPKIQSSEVKVVGNYIMYAILSDSDKAAAFSAFEKSLMA